MKRTLRWSALALACVFLSGCKDQNEPVKPIAKPALLIFIDY